MSEFMGWSECAREDGAIPSSTTPRPSAGASLRAPGAPANNVDTGNPFGRYVARNRRIFLAAFSEEKVMALIEHLFGMAMEGDLGAMKILLQYLIGKPLSASHLDRIESEEGNLRDEQRDAKEVATQTQSQESEEVPMPMQRAVIVETGEKQAEPFGDEAAARKAARAERRARRKEERRRRKRG